MIDFAKHLPPSADLPHVLALDERAATDLPPDLKTVTSLATGSPPDPVDAIIGYSAPTALNHWFKLLRPGGRLILATQSDPATLLQQLTESGFIHCLVETVADFTLYRGERPPVGNSLERIETLDYHSNLKSEIKNLKFIYLLVSQSPNKPVWKLTPGETIHWHAATLIHPHTQQPVLLAFTSLVKAVAFMQPAILGKRIGGVNKIGKFPSALANDWPHPVTLNPVYAEWQDAEAGPALEVDPQLAITGEE